MQKAAILGFGTVGSGVAEALQINRGRIAARTTGIELKYIVDVRDFENSPFADYMIKDFSIVENDPQVDFVVETIGGVGVAYDFTKRALKAGKSVVTSNKELVAAHGCELMALAGENGVSYLFEASVGGGVPMLRSLMSCLGSEEISELFGILNGTTNYILTQMFQNGMSFSAALAKAQQLGYSEANPTADIDGHDACRKVSILASLISGRWYKTDAIPTEGISGISVEDVDNAAAINCTIKLLGRIVFGEDGKLYPYVAPHLLKKSLLLSEVEGVMNGLTVRGKALGDVMFYGCGAGKLPTASAIVSDLYNLARNPDDGRNFAWKDENPALYGNVQMLETPWYVRVSADEIPKISGFHLISGGAGRVALYTDVMTETEMRKKLEGYTVLSSFRILE